MNRKPLLGLVGGRSLDFYPPVHRVVYDNGSLAFNVGSRRFAFSVGREPRPGSKLAVEKIPDELFATAAKVRRGGGAV